MGLFDISVGELRWPVTVARRRQNFDPPGSSKVGIFEDLLEPQVMHAKVEAAMPTTFYGAQMTDEPFSHFIWMRWLNYLDNTNVVLRDTTLPNGIIRSELFRVCRVQEMGGRKRFILIEARLEKILSQTGGSAETRPPTPLLENS